MTADLPTVPDEYRHPGADYRRRLPAMLADPTTDSRGEPCDTPVDRRWLWRLEAFLAVSGTTPAHHQMAADLQVYLGETCVHHPLSYGDIAQCAWCHIILPVAADAEVTQ